MAKERAIDQKPERSDRIEELALQLFSKHWRPDGKQIDDGALAAFCFLGAREFSKIAARIAEGQSPDELLSVAPASNVSVS